MACALLLTMAVMAPVTAGWMRMCHSADRGAPVSPMQLFSVFRDFPTWGRLLAYVLMIIAVTAALLLLLYRCSAASSRT
jgi:hypothetical protein